MKPNGIPAIPSTIVTLERTGVRKRRVPAHLQYLAYGVKRCIPGRTVLAATVIACGFLDGTSTVGGGQAPAPSGQAGEMARIHGRVTDQTGGVVPGVELTLRYIENNISKTTVSNDFGEFEFIGLTQGKYELSAAMAGFETFRKTVSIGPGGNLAINPVLKVGAPTNVIEVASTAAAIQVKSYAVAAPSRSFRLAHLPNWHDPNFNTEAYDHIVDNSFIQVADDARSTFSIDVDTASYSNLRRFLSDGELPPEDAVRIEELINYFPYSHPNPLGDQPFEVSLEMASAPWNPAHRLLAIGIQGREVDMENRPGGNFVFLIDVSGSMRSPAKLPLLKQGLRFLVEQFAERDRISMVVYAGASELVLPPTSGANKAGILEALESLEAGGSTNGGEGIQLAYDLATQNFLEGGINRVILATDGDFNVGITNQGDLTRLIQEKAKSNVFLTVLGFGTGNLKDSTMEKLADRGNGNYAYIDSLPEARKVLVEEMGATLVTIAKDVKIQVEFNPVEIEAFRLIGYENRLLEHQDFNDDRKDAGEIGAGHSLTVLYELVPIGQEGREPRTDPLRYQATTELTGNAFSGKLMLLKLRYKDPESEKSRLLEIPVYDDTRTFQGTTDDFRFAAAVAGFGMLLRASPYKGDATFDHVLSWAQDALGTDPGGYRQGFLQRGRKAKPVNPLSQLVHEARGPGS